MSIQLELDLIFPLPKMGELLYPQPPCFTDCIESNKLGTFNFYDGSPMEGHYIVDTIRSLNLNLVPFFDLKKEKWIWIIRNEK